MTTTINGRTPEEIKRWLNCEISQYNHSCEEYYTCYACPNFDLQMDDRDDIPEATLAYIQQLERERDAAVEDIFPMCTNCKHEKLGYGVGSCPPIEEYLTNDCSNWQWRGVQQEAE